MSRAAFFNGKREMGENTLYFQLFSLEYIVYRVAAAMADRNSAFTKHRKMYSAYICIFIFNMRN